MQTLAQAQNFTQAKLVKGVMLGVVTVSDVLKVLPFEDIEGNGLSYNRESTLPTFAFYNRVDDIVMSDLVTTNQTAALKILAGGVDISKFDEKVYSDKNNQKAIQLDAQTKSLARTFEDNFFYGDDSVDSKSFDGLHALVDSSMQINQGSGSTGAALSANNLDKAIDYVKQFGQPNAIFMNRNIRRRLGQYVRANNASFSLDRDEFGYQYTSYGGVRIVESDWLTQTETIASGAYSAKTGGATTSVFVAYLGPKAVHGIQNGGIQVDPVGRLENKLADRYHVYWFCGMVLYSVFALARIDGITDVAVVT